MTPTTILPTIKGPATAEAGTASLKADLQHVLDAAKERCSAQPISLLHTVVASEGAYESFETRIVAVFSSPAEAEYYAKLLTDEAAADDGTHDWKHPIDAGYCSAAQYRDSATFYGVGQLMLSELTYTDAYIDGLSRLQKLIKALR